MGDFTPLFIHCHFGSSLGRSDQSGNVLNFSPALPALVVWVVHAVGVGLAWRPGAVATCGCTSYASSVRAGLPEPRGSIGRDLVVTRVALRGSSGHGGGRYSLYFAYCWLRTVAVLSPGGLAL